MRIHPSDRLGRSAGRGHARSYMPTRPNVFITFAIRETRQDQGHATMPGWAVRKQPTQHRSHRTRRAKPTTSQGDRTRKPLDARKTRPRCNPRPLRLGPPSISQYCCPVPSLYKGNRVSFL
uniref:Uncharacterized protein n=1 Tax=Setaria italica TaxID=4555 RepID=K3XN93_SETIT